MPTVLNHITKTDRKQYKNSIIGKLYLNLPNRIVHVDIRKYYDNYSKNLTFVVVYIFEATDFTPTEVALKKIVLTGGGTAGHCLPNLALVPSLKEMGYNVLYIGSYNGIEKNLVEKTGLQYYGISSGKLRRYFDKKNFTDPFRVMKGYREAKKILKSEKPDIVFSKGGYVTVPVVRAARSLRIPVVIHESDMTPGLANRLSAGSASKICCSFEKTLEFLPDNKAVFTGAPIRPEILLGDRERAKKFVHMREGDYPFVMVIGGSLGAQHVNEAIRSCLPRLLKKYNIIHLCGKGKVDPTLNRTPGYMQYDYIDEELPDLYALSDIVVSRAGASVIFELLALKKPNILIPLPTASSRGDQLLNATAFSKAGYSVLLTEERMNDEMLPKTIDELFMNRETYIEKMSNAPELSAVEKICDIIKKESK